MPDITTVAAFLVSIKNATDIAKAIKGADVSLEKAEFKLKLAELIEALAEAKMQAADVQEIIREKDKEIDTLRKAFELKSTLVKYGNAYYEKNNIGIAINEPYCLYCWEANQKALHLILFNHNTSGEKMGFCTACQTQCNLEQTFE